MPFHGSRGASIALILSYVFDWIVIVLLAVVGALLSRITPNKRPFNVYDPSLSFPYVAQEKISTNTLILVAVVAPAIIILLVSLILVPGPTVPKSIPSRLIWRRKLWEWFIGWTGLALSSAAALLIISGMKNLFGKPRPHTLAACQPDLANLANYVVGGFSNGYVNSVLVSADICQSTDTAVVKDTFRSFPSGHSATSAAGLVYLSLYLCAKLSITIPFLAPRAYSSNNIVFSAFPSRAERQALATNSSQTSGGTKLMSLSTVNDGSRMTSDNSPIVAARNQSAAPPLYLIVFAIVPVAVSIYICSTRFSDFYHFGFDILFGFSVGLFCAFMSFNFYHLPISQGAGWAWAPRSPKRAFWAGIGVGTYARGGTMQEGLAHAAMADDLGRRAHMDDEESGSVGATGMGAEAGSSSRAQERNSTEVG